MSERSGVEIDYCPECRGVWLDRGELDKIIERAENDIAKSAPVAAPAPHYTQDSRPRTPQYGERNDFDRGDNDRRYNDRDGYRKSKKESWIADLFG
jgi:Zn-finger nucleic acid-binding protein